MNPARSEQGGEQKGIVEKNCRYTTGQNVTELAGRLRQTQRNHCSL